MEATKMWTIIGAVNLMIQLSTLTVPVVCTNGQQLTEYQKLALAELKQLVKKDIMTQEYMMEDLYLTRWLQKQNFNVNYTLQLLQEYLEWRKEQKMDSILTEDWTDMYALFPYSRDAIDKCGRPILYYDWGEWDVAAFLETGQLAYDRMLRYMFMYREETAAHVRRGNEQESNITKFTFIINAGGFSPAKHACTLCLKLPKDLNHISAKFLPAVESENEIIINVPKSFSPVYSQLPETAKAKIMFYGQDRSQWEKKLLDIVHLDQFPSGIFREHGQKDNSYGLLKSNWDKEL